MLGKALLFSLLATTGAGHPPDEPIRLTLDLSARRLEVWQGDERIRNYTVTIGQEGYETPAGNYAISRIEWNPRWVPPPGRDWTRGKKETGPGKGNPMGRVKMQFDDYLYVHGTWSTKQLGGAHSHGCIRLSNKDALELARMIALPQGVVSEGEVASLEKNSRRTRSVRLAYTVPLHIRHAVTAERPTQDVDEAGTGLLPPPEGSAPSGPESDTLVGALPPGR